MSIPEKLPVSFHDFNQNNIDRVSKGQIKEVYNELVNKINESNTPVERIKALSSLKVVRETAANQRPSKLDNIFNKKKLKVTKEYIGKLDELIVKQETEIRNLADIKGSVDKLCMNLSEEECIDTLQKMADKTQINNLFALVKVPNSGTTNGSEPGDQYLLIAFNKDTNRFESKPYVLDQKGAFYENSPQGKGPPINMNFQTGKFEAVSNALTSLYGTPASTLSRISEDTLEKYMATPKLSRMLEHKFETVTPEDILLLNNRVEITNQNYSKLDLRELYQNSPEQFPKYKMSYGNVNYYCSAPFISSDKSKHPLVFALIEKNGKLYPRIFYLSNSQGTWRVLPTAEKQDTSGTKDFSYYGKGLSEVDTQLPAAVNLALHSVAQESVQETRSNLYHQLVQTANRRQGTEYHQNREVLDYSRMQDQAKQFFEQIAFARPHLDPHRTRLAPDSPLLPDFSKGKEYPLYLPLYGNVTARVYPSKDESSIYTFYEMEDGRAFLASADKVDAPITTYGNRQEAIALYMDAPLLEYPKQIHRDYYPNSEINNPYSKDPYYTSNWNFVRELPIIKLYYEAQNRELPPQV